MIAFLRNPNIPAIMHAESRNLHEGVTMPEATFTVSELNEFLKISFDNSEILRDIYIKGEISNFTNHFKTSLIRIEISSVSSSIFSVSFSE